MNTKDLGSTTAYASAVEGGYTGTREEWYNMLLLILSGSVEVPYDTMANRPMINGRVVTGDMSLEELGFYENGGSCIRAKIDTDIDAVVTATINGKTFSGSIKNDVWVDELGDVTVICGGNEYNLTVPHFGLYYYSPGYSTVTISTPDESLYGKDVFIVDSNSNVIESGTFSNAGITTIQTVAYGNYTVISTDGEYVGRTDLILYADGGEVNTVIRLEKSVIHITTVDPLLDGAAVVIKKGGETFATGVFVNGSLDVSVKEFSDYVVETSAYDISATETVTVSEYYETYDVSLNLSYATVNVTTTEGTLKGETVTVIQNNQTIKTGAIDNNGNLTLYLPVTGDITITALHGEDVANSVLTVAYGQSYNVQLVYNYLVINIRSEDLLLEGQQITLTGNGQTYAQVMISGVCSFRLKKTGDYIISASSHGYSLSEQISVDEYFKTYDVSVHLPHATLSITAMDEALYGANFSVEKGETIIATGVISSDGKAIVHTDEMGVLKVKSSNGETKASAKVTVDAFISYAVELAPLKIVTWADGTWDEISAMIDAHDIGEINIYDYWSVGDTRTVNIAAIASSGSGSASDIGTSVPSQDVGIVLVDKNVVNLKDGGECHFVWQQKELLANGTSSLRGSMNRSLSSGNSWADCNMRKWCNNDYYGALPSGMQNIVKTVEISTSAGNKSNDIVKTEEKVFLPAEYNITGIVNVSVVGEDNTIWEWYKIRENRIKYIGNTKTSDMWWLRSPLSGNGERFCIVFTSGSVGADSMSQRRNIAPCGCI